ncbi:unnamed protein product [Prorocentrum cordatum]|uniref:Uncharacterized protein n=1 Tax=Prorocentrum cordatum TaxID=2364126 RepID=A0ABN9TBY8_9DINO|nr:unnamed protein product [Polarella glacialis]
MCQSKLGVLRSFAKWVQLPGTSCWQTRRRRGSGGDLPLPLKRRRRLMGSRRGRRGGALKHLRWLARSRAQLVGDGPEADAAASALAARWGAELSTALHWATSPQLQTALGHEAAQAFAAALADELARYARGGSRRGGRLALGVKVASIVVAVSYWLAKALVKHNGC